MSIQKTFLHYMLCIRIVPFQTVEILFGLVNMSIDYITLKLKKNHSLSQPHFYKRNIQLKRESEIKNELIDLRSKVSSSIFAGSRAWTYLGYIILVTLSVWPHDLRFSSVPVKCKKNQHWYQDWVWLTWMKETNMVYYEISDTVHLIGISKFIKFYIRHQFWKPKLTILLIFHYLQSVPKI